MLLHHHQEQQQQHQQQQQQQQCHQHNSQHYQQGWSSADDPVLTLQLQALAACRRLAALGVRHNDIKTNNFLVDAAGSVRIIDFGQASREPHGYSAAGLFAEELATWSLQYGPREPPGTEVMMECVAYLHNPAAAHPLHSHFCSLL
jgi:serine/threonine protein kinase